MGYGMGYWSHPSWYYWTPFHPAFYYSPGYYMGGQYYPEQFSFTRFLFGVILIFFIIWLILRIFGGGKRIRYTQY